MSTRLVTSAACGGAALAILGALGLGVIAEKRGVANAKREWPAWVYCTDIDGVHILEAETGRTGEIVGLHAEPDSSLAPDGSAVFFSSELDDHPGIWRLPTVVGKATVGKRKKWSEVRRECRQLTTGASDRDPMVSPDGRLLAFSREGRIAVAAADGRDVRLVSLPNPYGRVGRKRFLGDLGPAWSPDGTRIVYTRAEIGRAPQLWLFRLATGDNVQLTREGDLGTPGTHSPTWGPSGHTIAAIRNNCPTMLSDPCGDLQEGHLVFMDPTNGAEIAEWPAGSVETLVGWLPAGNGVAFVSGLALFVAVFPNGFGGDTAVVNRIATGVGSGAAIEWDRTGR